MPMRYLSLILALVVLLLSTEQTYCESMLVMDDSVSCSQDSCTDDECDNCICSPFSNCSTCFGFPEAKAYHVTEFVTILLSKNLNIFYSDCILFDFVTSILKPPRFL